MDPMTMMGMFSNMMGGNAGMAGRPGMTAGTTGTGNPMLDMFSAMMPGMMAGQQGQTAGAGAGAGTGQLDPMQLMMQLFGSMMGGGGGMMGGGNPLASLMGGGMMGGDNPLASLMGGMFGGTMGGGSPFGGMFGGGMLGAWGNPANAGNMVQSLLSGGISGALNMTNSITSTFSKSNLFADLLMGGASPELQSAIFSELSGGFGTNFLQTGLNTLNSTIGQGGVVSGAMADVKRIQAGLADGTIKPKGSEDKEGEEDVA